MKTVAHSRAQWRCDLVRKSHGSGMVHGLEHGPKDLSTVNGISVASLTFEVASTFAWVVSCLNSFNEFILLDNDMPESISRISSRTDWRQCGSLHGGR